MTTIRTLACVLTHLFLVGSFGLNLESFRVPLSGSWGVGSLGDSKTDLPSRTMGAFSIEALPSYEWNDWLFGVHLDYRWQQQYTSLADAGGTNWRGSGYLLGLGVRRNFGRFFLQGALDFIGVYDLARNSSRNEDSSFSGPLGLRVKAGYAPFTSIPALSIHLDAQTLGFREITFASNKQSSNGRQLMVMIGATFEFEKLMQHADEKPTVEVPVQTQASKPAVTQVAAAQAEELSKILETKQTDKGLMLNLKGDMSFASGSSNLSTQAQEAVHKAAEVLAKNPDVKIRIEGHTDSVGNKDKNLSLSKARAQSVKDALAQAGIKSENIAADGFGDKRPVQSNATSAGRASNRRVEIYIDYQKAQ